MHDRMNSAPGYGASPSRHSDYDLDQHTARQITDMHAELQRLGVSLADRIAMDIERHAMWPPEHEGDRLEKHIVRMRQQMRWLIEDAMHADKLEEAEEIA